MDKRKRLAIKKGMEKVNAAPEVQAKTAAVQAKEQAAVAVKAAGAEAKGARGGAVVIGKDGISVAMPPLPKMQSAARANTERKIKPTRDCACGCGTPTKSEWAPGHDARARGWAIRIQRGIMTIDQVPANEQAGANLMLSGAAEGKIKLVHSNKGKLAQAPEAAEATGTEGK